MDKLARNQGDFRHWWSHAPQLDENDLRDGILELLNKIHEASVYDDWDSVQDHVKLYQLGETYCSEEPRLSAYEFGKMGIDCIYANAAFCKGDYAGAMEKLAAVKTTYDARMERYARLGMPPRRASEIRYRYLLHMADLKWLAPEEWCNTLQTPESVITDFYETRDHIISFLQANPGSHANERSLRQGMALTELVCCKMALRYLPDRLPDLVQHFIRNNSEQLILPQVEHNLSDAAKSPHTAYFWDFELAKLRVTPRPQLQDIYMCIELRALAAHNTFEESSIQALLRGWRREALLIVREAQAKKEA